MGDEDHGQHLPQRVRGSAQGGSAPSTAPVLSAEMRRRIQAAVRAERAGTTVEDNPEDKEPSSVPPRRGTAARPAPDVMSPVGGKIKKANGNHKRHVKPEHAAKSEHSGKPVSLSTPVSLSLTLGMSRQLSRSVTLRMGMQCRRRKVRGR